MYDKDGPPPGCAQVLALIVALFRRLARVCGQPREGPQTPPWPQLRPSRTAITQLFRMSAHPPINRCCWNAIRPCHPRGDCARSTHTSTGPFLVPPAAGRAGIPGTGRSLVRVRALASSGGPIPAPCSDLVGARSPSPAAVDGGAPRSRPRCAAVRRSAPAVRSLRWRRGPADDGCHRLPRARGRRGFRAGRG